MRLPNPIVYTYLKDREQYSEEKELRVSLSAIGMGHFVLDDGSLMALHPACSCRSISDPLLRTGQFNRYCMGRIAILSIFMPGC
jgi:hypothetical protein